MPETSRPAIDPAATAAAAEGLRARGPRPRRKADVTPRAQAAARRTRVVQVALLFVAAVITIDAVVGEKGLLQTFRARRAQAQLVASIGSIRAENARMRDEARRLKEDPLAIEEAARRNLGLVKPGEVLVIIKDAARR